MYIDQIKNFNPTTTQEKADKKAILEYIDLIGDDILERESKLAHLTSSMGKRKLISFNIQLN